MKTSKWEAFLSDQELINNSNYYNPPDGKYLFGKILHDVLECLNNFTGLLDLMFTGEEEIPTNILSWFRSKRTFVESIINNINSLWKYHHEQSNLDNEWPDLIKIIGMKLDGIPTLALEFEKLKKPSEISESDFVNMAIANINCLSAIHADIQAEEYKRLWIIRKYQELG